MSAAPGPGPGTDRVAGGRPQAGGWLAGRAALLLALAAGPSGALAAQDLDSLVSTAQRAARAWRAHDFRQLVGSTPRLALALPGSAPTAPLRAGQAAEVLRAFAEGAIEVEVEVLVARVVDRERAYVEIRRVFRSRGSQSLRTQTVYIGLRRSQAGFQVAEVRVVP